ncbi:hypothetical protein L218DRAFT_948810 [Marasmius fiardii PR-910]|nr:hypothetical protein L218DRAFT_948810 [Marasmius fiardii PR-910]
MQTGSKWEHWHDGLSQNEWYRGASWALFTWLPVGDVVDGEGTGVGVTPGKLCKVGSYREDASLAQAQIHQGLVNTPNIKHEPKNNFIKMVPYTEAKGLVLLNKTQTAIGGIFGADCDNLIYINSCSKSGSTASPLPTPALNKKQHKSDQIWNKVPFIVSSNESENGDDGGHINLKSSNEDESGSRSGEEGNDSELEQDPGAQSEGDDDKDSEAQKVMTAQFTYPDLEDPKYSCGGSDWFQPCILPWFIIATFGLGLILLLTLRSLNTNRVHSPASDSKVHQSGTVRFHTLSVEYKSLALWDGFCRDMAKCLGKQNICEESKRQKAFNVVILDRASEKINDKQPKGGGSSSKKTKKGESNAVDQAGGCTKRCNFNGVIVGGIRGEEQSFLLPKQLIPFSEMVTTNRPVKDQLKNFWIFVDATVVHDDNCVRLPTVTHTWHKSDDEFPKKLYGE